MLKMRFANIILISVMISIVIFFLLQLNVGFRNPEKLDYIKNLSKQIEQREIRIKKYPKDQKKKYIAAFGFNLKNPNDQVIGLKYLASKVKLIKDSKNFLVLNSKTVKKYGYNFIGVSINKISCSSMTGYAGRSQPKSVFISRINIAKSDNSILDDVFSSLKTKKPDEKIRYIDWRTNNYRCVSAITQTNEKLSSNISSTTHLNHKYGWLDIAIDFDKNTTDEMMKKTISDIISNLELIELLDT